jgi:hypothetical protein
MKSSDVPKSDPGKDSFDSEPLPRLNPWLAFALLVLALFAHVMIWKELLGG